MRVQSKSISIFSALGVALVIGFVSEWLTPTTTRAAQGPCTTRPDNMTRNGSITDDGYGTPHGVVAHSWNSFLISGDYPIYELAYSENANGDIPGASQYIYADEYLFDGGIYQVITGTQPGASYEFSIGLGFMLRDIPTAVNQKFDDVIMRRAGVDPYGGTDPRAPTVIWSPELGSGSYSRSLNHPNLRVVFQAMSNQVTVFVRAYNLDYSTRDKVFFDVMCLVPRPDIPVANIEPSPTPTLPATEIPPTLAPTRARNTPLPTVTNLPTETRAPTRTPTRAPTFAPLVSNTRVAPIEPAVSSARTRVAISQIAGTSQTNPAENSAREFGVVGILGVVGVTGALVLLGAAAFLLLRRK